MDILTRWLRSYLPALDVNDAQLAQDLTLRGIAVEGEFPAACGGARYEMDITTNRVDAMNHYGVAREVAAMYGVALQGIAAMGEEPRSATGIVEQVDSDGFAVRIEAEDVCGRFTARVVRGVTVGPATGLVAEYFEALGQKAISAPVDATNYGWLAMGQPTHVFDLDTIEGGIVVRRARAGEVLRLLDGSERTLVAEDLVVADERRALGLAGVMGGWDSRVTEATTNILVEAAWFEPATVRASSRRHGLHTDASHRFERGADFAAAPVANELVTKLVVAMCGGVVSGPLVDVVVPAWAAKTAERAPIVLRVSEVRRHLGATLDGKGISAEVVETFLRALGCVLTAQGAAETYAVTLPSWRLDLEREIDLIEEVARVYGYNAFANTLPSFAGAVRELPHAEQERALRDTLRGLGYTEMLSSTFVAEDEAAVFGDATAGAVAMGNPLSAEAGMLRPSLVAGMASALAANLHRDVAEARLFELGTVFTGSTATVHEQTGLALGLMGGAAGSGLYAADDALFFEAKGAVAALLAKFEGAVTFDAVDLPKWIEAGRGVRALLDGVVVAWIGELHAAEAARRKLRQVVVLGEVKAALLLRAKVRVPRVREVSRFQAVERDFSFVLPDAVSWESVAAAVRGLGIGELQSVAPIEVFRDAKGKALAAGTYSLLLRLKLQSAERTLTEEELAAWSETIATALVGLGGVRRA